MQNYFEGFETMISAR